MVAQAVQDVIEHANRPGAGVAGLVVGLVVLLFGASGVFNQLQTALNAIWKVKPKPGRGVWTVVGERFLSFTMVLGTIFLLLVSLVVSSALATLSRSLQPPVLSQLLLWQGLNLLVSLAVVCALFTLLLKFLPDAKVAWTDAFLGAALTTVLFTTGKELLGLYIGKSGVASAYGAAGSLAVLLLWVYYSAQIFLFGAAFTRVYAEHCG
jgi:membrane protein